MVKVKAEAKVAVKAKSKTATSAVAAVGSPVTKVRLAGQKEANDTVNTSHRGSAKKTAAALQHTIAQVAK